MMGGGGERPAPLPYPMCHAFDNIYRPEDVGCLAKRTHARRTSPERN